MSQIGALYPWRTINGEEASAYYAAGTAQYHINAAVVFALRRYLEATGDVDFLAHEGAEILVETARLWADLGFYASNGSQTFHIHRVTGPDEYTTVVNDNTYTNVMARFNLRYAARTVRFLADWNPEAFEHLVRATDLDLGELDAWDAAADAMFIPFDDELGIHPQDSSFLELEPWDWEGTPADKYPLLLNFHPLVIYRHQVLKQADVVLATFLRREHFSPEQKRRNFDYYDPITTGDSSLSACVQAIVAAEVGYDELALDYFHRALYLDLCDSHGNTADGVHVASAGGVWAGIVHGFAGMVERRRPPRVHAASAEVVGRHRRSTSAGTLDAARRPRSRVLHVDRRRRLWAYRSATATNGSSSPPTARTSSGRPDPPLPEHRRSVPASSDGFGTDLEAGDPRADARLESAGADRQGVGVAGRGVDDGTFEGVDRRRG